MIKLKSYVEDFSHLFFPIQCVGCDAPLNHEDELLCPQCETHLPFTAFETLQTPNLVEKIFWGRLPLKHATSFLYFSKKGAVPSMLHKLKYAGREDVGSYLGDRFGNALRATKFSNVDAIIPVPLHPLKLKKRGYNQCDSIGKVMADQLGSTFLSGVVQRVQANKSQTKLGRYERWKNVETLFKVVQPTKLTGKKVLIIDDVITTGSTIEACALAVSKVKDVEVSVASIACPPPY